jgi:hypothetical protein
MDSFGFPDAIAIVAICLTISVVFYNWFKYRDRRLELRVAATAERAAQYAAGTERMEQRLRVLERIVTDKGLVVADEIENLRDKPLN